MSGETLDLEMPFGDQGRLASYILDEWYEKDAYREPAKSRWEEIEAYKYATDTKNSLMGGSAFDHSTHIPVIAPISQDLEAIVGQVTMPHEDWFTFQPEDRASAPKEKRSKVVSYIKNRHRISGFKKEKEKLDSDLVTYGNAFAMVEWIDESSEDKGGYIGPKLMRISPYDIVFDPTASSFDSSYKIIRQIISMGKLLQWKEKGLVNTDAADLILANRRTHGTRRMTSHEKDQQYTPQGFTTYDAYMTSGVVEILWFYGDIYDQEGGKLHKNRKIASVDGTYVLFDEEIDTHTGKPHIYKAGWEVRPDNLWSMGPLDNIVGINYQVNHRENAKNDALDKLIYPDKVFVGDVEEKYDDETGQTIYLAPEGGGVQEIAMNTQFFQYNLEIDALTNMARTSARLPLDLVGFRSPGEKTFGEVSALTEGAMRGFIHKTMSYESFLEEILTAELELAHKHISGVLQVPGQAEGGIIPFLDVTRADLKVSGSLVAKGSQRFARKNQMMSTLSQLSATGILDRTAVHQSSKKLAELVEELTELDGFGVFEEYAQVYESAELQQLQNEAQMQVLEQGLEPTLDEVLEEEELQELDNLDGLA